MFDSIFSSFHSSKTINIQITTDIHTHLLPRVDDGFSDERKSIEMMLFLQEKGVKRIYLTPHVMADYTMNCSSFLKRRFSGFLEEWKEQHGEITIRLAAEYMLDEGFYVHLKGGLLTYDGCHILVELSCQQRPMNLSDMLYNIQLDGYIPILAHPERYGFFARSDFQWLKEFGCEFQLNLFSLFGYYGKAVQATSRELLRYGFYSYIGTDIHSLNYQPLYTACKFSEKELTEIDCLIQNNDLLWNRNLKN